MPPDGPGPAWSGPTTTVVLRGEVDAACEEHLDTLAGNALTAGHPVVLDVGAVTFMDSTGAAFIATLARGLGAGRVTVVRATPQVRFLLTVTRLASVVRIAAPADPPA